MKPLGFSLIELLITLCLASILAAAGITSYSHHLTHAKRLHAETLLSQLAIELEHYQIEYGSYKDASLTKLNPTLAQNNRDYEFSLLTTTDNDYLLAATPRHTQATNDPCGTLMLNAAGEKKISGKMRIQDCW